MPEQLVAGGADFLLRVKGDSMIDAGILDGDFVVVRKADTAVNGDIVVALAGDDESLDEATVKRYFRESGRIRLQPENSSSSRSTRSTSRSSARWWGCSGRYERGAVEPDARAGALRAAPRREPRVPRLR